MYIVRENIIFTLLGIIGGFGVGYILTDFILQQASMENVIFPLVITWWALCLISRINYRIHGYCDDRYPFQIKAYRYD